VVRLADEVDVARGDLLAVDREPRPAALRELVATVCWLADARSAPVIASRCGTQLAMYEPLWMRCGAVWTWPLLTRPMRRSSG
jgi:hypothetical protein